MKRLMKKMIPLSLVVLLVISFALQGLAEAPGSALTDQQLVALEETGEHSSGSRRIPVRELTRLQIENEQDVIAMLPEAAKEQEENGFLYRLLEDGTAIITGSTGMETKVTIPYSVNGADVVAIGEAAFGDTVRAATIHGNVFHIGDSAFTAGAAGCIVSAWQGSYAAAWAQKNGF